MITLCKTSVSCIRIGWRIRFIIACIGLLILRLLVSVNFYRPLEIEKLHQINTPDNQTIDQLSSTVTSKSNGRRKCSRLVLILHVHKAGGTSVLEFMKKGNNVGIYEANAHLKPPLVQLMSAQNTTVPKYGLYGYECDQLAVYSKLGDTIVPTPRSCTAKRRRRRGTKAYASNSTEEVSSLSVPPPLQLSDASLWRGIHDAGVDYVAFERNFLPPTVFVEFFDEIRPVITSLALLREPWARFHSTYQRELFLKCKRGNSFPESLTDKCIQSNTLANWIKDSNLKGNKRFPGTLRPNYMVRILNGLTDQPNLQLTQEHLEIAKVALQQFDLVLYLEMPEKERLAALRNFFGTNDRAKLKRISNNNLKKYPIYDEIVAKTSLLKPLFDELNALDLELYEFTRVLVERRRREPAVHCKDSKGL